MDLRPRPPATAALPLKDTLRALRLTLRKGRDLLPPLHDELPRPLKDVANTVLHGVDVIGEEVESVTSKAAHELLDTKKQLDEEAMLGARPGGNGASEAAFAEAAYHALSHALGLLGAEGYLVSEVSAAEAYRAAARSGAGKQSRHDQAARLMAAMIDRQVVRRLSSGSDELGGTAARQALFACALWLIAPAGERSGRDEDERLAICVEVASALGPDLDAAGKDVAALSALLDAFAETV